MLTENDVVDAVAKSLESAGYRIDNKCSTRERGIDIEATNLATGRRLLVEAKGGTSSKHYTDRFGQPFSLNQAKSHISRALLCAVQLLQNDPPPNRKSDVALAFPADRNHKKIIGEITLALSLLKIAVFFVDEYKNVETLPNGDEEIAVLGG